MVVEGWRKGGGGRDCQTSALSLTSKSLLLSSNALKVKMYITAAVFTLIHAASGCSVIFMLSSLLLLSFTETQMKVEEVRSQFLLLTLREDPCAGEESEGRESKYTRKEGVIAAGCFLTGCNAP